MEEGKGVDEHGGVDDSAGMTRGGGVEDGAGMENSGVVVDLEGDDTEVVPVPLAPRINTLDGALPFPIIKCEKIKRTCTCIFYILNKQSYQLSLLLGPFWVVSDVDSLCYLLYICKHSHH